MLALLMAVSPLWGREPVSKAGDFRALAVSNKQFTVTIGDVWTTFTNFGEHGDAATILPGYSRPGNTPGQNVYYLWDGRIWVASFVNGQKYVTHYDYSSIEWTPSDDNGPTGFAWIGADKSYLDVEARYEDFAGNSNNSGNHLGLKVIERLLSWPHDPYNQFFAYEMGITYNKNMMDITSSPPDSIEIYVGWQYDADVCGADPESPYIDDLVYYDGAPEECNILLMSHKMGWEDSVAIYIDTTIIFSDDIPDGFTIWGDDPEEKEITIAYYENKFGPGARPDSFMLIRPNRDNPDRVDTVYYYYLIPRNTSFIYDWDNPRKPGDDIGDGGACTGYIGMRLIYAPPTSNDAIATDGGRTGSICTAITTAKSIGAGDTIRIIYPRAHQWWNWENDPGDDNARYDYMVGNHPATRPYRFAPHPFDFGASEFDYRFLLTSGPHWIRDGDTIWFVVVGAVGEGLNGDTNGYWYGGSYKLGLRQVMDQALLAYYTGAEGNCDPAHPCAPNDAVHWRIPIPPVSPALSYGAVNDSVVLLWDKKAEYTPDPIKKTVDFVGYAIYRAKFGPKFNQPPIKIIIDASRPAADRDALRSYWINYWMEKTGVDISDRIEEKTLEGPNTFVDRNPPKGYPLYYVVTAFDNDSLESAKNNYLKTPQGTPRPIYVGGPPGGDDWVDNIVIAPNPVYGSTKWSATKITPEVRFFNVPPSARIDIYSFTGDHIKTLYNNLETTGSVVWNLLTPQGRMVSPGIYFVRITDGEKTYIGKFVVLR
ncbi:MAG: T9SS type A sorting domain-containing protein [Thermotogae bacterium]|nr:T9SS type A sorting domain-containing protein [Thermotogota bacterium]